MRAWIAFGVLGAAIAAAVACSSSSNDAKPSTGDRLCTPGNYVYCRCADRSEGTKLCAEDGQSFAECKCGEGTPDPDTGFEPYDAGGKPTSGPLLPDACTNKLAVLASAADPSVDLYAGLYQGAGAFAVGKSSGAPLRGIPHATTVGEDIIAVWTMPDELVGWTKFSPRQTSLAPPVTLGDAIVKFDPSIAGSARMLFEYDDMFYQGRYTTTGGWDDATDSVPTNAADGGAKLVGKSGPALAAIGNEFASAYTAGGNVVVQTTTADKWSTQSIIATGASGLSPALATIEGPKDLLLVFQGTDLVLRYMLHDATTKAWSAPALVDTTATSEARPELVPMKSGRAMLVWKVGGQPQYSVYDATVTPTWTLPAGLVSQNPTVKNTPGIWTGGCGADATAAYVDDQGNVFVVQFAGAKWNGPYPIVGLTKMAWAGVGVLP